MTRQKKAETFLHDKAAPYWAAALFIFLVTGLLTIWKDFGPFWKGYVLDMTGPAWNYILFRGLFTAKSDNGWTRFFTPVKTLVIFILICACIEMAQFSGLYDATFDPYDFLAYISLLLPVFLTDLFLYRKSE